MAMKKSKTIPLDRRDIHSLLGFIGGYGLVVAVGIIAMLSVVAAFVIYRTVKGQEQKNGVRNEEGERGSKNPLRDKGREEEDQRDESTGECEDSNMDESETETKNIQSYAMEDQEGQNEDSPPDHLTVQDLHDSQNLAGQNSGTESLQSTDQGYQCEMSDYFEEEIEDRLRENDSEKDEEAKDATECHENKRNHEEPQPSSQGFLSSQGDVKERSLSAHEPMSSIQDDSVETRQPQDLLTDTKSHFVTDHEKTKTDDLVTSTGSSLEKHLSLQNDFDCGGIDEQCIMPGAGLGSREKIELTEELIKCSKNFDWGQNVSANPLSKSECLIGQQLQSYKYEYVNDYIHQGYLGFSSGFNLTDRSPLQVKVRNCCETKGVPDVNGLKGPLEENPEKTEISIMEATMDNNEWLSVGGPETQDLPWLTQTTTNPSKGLISEAEPSNMEKQDALTVTPRESNAVVASFDDDHVHKRVATVTPLPQTVQVSFKVHYITHTSSQVLAVTGNQEELGFWENSVPLQRAKDGFWTSTITLPMETQVEWKFVLVEDGKVCRWEECSNRCLVLTSQEDEILLDKSWGIH